MVFYDLFPFSTLLNGYILLNIQLTAWLQDEFHIRQYEMKDMKGEKSQ